MRVERSRAAFQTTPAPTPPIPLTMIPFFLLLSFQIALWVVRYARHMAPVIATHARAIVVGVMLELVEQMYRITSDMANRCVPALSHLGNANCLQGECGVRYSCRGRPRPPRHLGHAPCARRGCACDGGLQGGSLPQPCRPLLGENGELLFFILEDLLTLCHTAGRREDLSLRQGIYTTAAMRWW